MRSAQFLRLFFAEFDVEEAPGIMTRTLVDELGFDSLEMLRLAVLVDVFLPYVPLLDHDSYCAVTLEEIAEMIDRDGTRAAGQS